MTLSFVNMMVVATVLSLWGDKLRTHEVVAFALLATGLAIFFTALEIKDTIKGKKKP